MPSNKVSVAALAAAVTAIVVWALRTYGNLDLPPEVKEALGVLLIAALTLLGGYLMPEKDPSQSAQQTLLDRGWSQPPGEQGAEVTGPLR